MIKVQPASSRMEKTESPGRILLRMPAKGLLTAWTCLTVCSLGWVACAAWGAVEAWHSDTREASYFAAALALPGVIGVIVALARSCHSWSLERDSQWMTFRTAGILGRRTRRWPASDVSSLFVEELRDQEGVGGLWELSIGFRNGRREILARDSDEEDLRWTVAMLTEPRGERKTSSPLLLAAEPERRKVDPAIVPATLRCRTYEGGVDIVFQPLLRARGLWWKLPLAAILGIVGVAGASFFLYRATHGAFPLAIPRLVIAGIVGLAGWKIWTLSKRAVVQVAEGMVFILERPGKKRAQFGKVDVEHVQTFTSAGRTELQFLLKGQPKVRLFEGRPAEELEWAARFLRVAIKGRSEPETTAMKVDASAGECQVCLEKMDRRVVYCAKCRTPHHEECWSYMGMCSTYGCREIRFERK